MQNYQIRDKIHPKQKVMVLLKEDYGTGTLTQATVEDVLTNTDTHYRGIKVRIKETGDEPEEVKERRKDNPDYRRIGRVKEILPQKKKPPVL